MAHDPTPCPGDKLYARLPEIAVRANAIMKKTPDPIDGGDKPMTEEERTLLNDTAEVVDTHTQVRYHTVEDLPDWYQKEIQYLVSKEYLKGVGGNNLELSLDMTRLYTVMARAVIDLQKKIESLELKIEEMSDK